MNNRGMESLKRSGSASGKTKVSRKKQLQRLKPVEDERKLQTISIIEGLNRKVKTFFVLSKTTSSRQK